MAGPTPDVSLTRFGAAVLFIELWFCCHGNALEARAAGELFLAWCCNVRGLGTAAGPAARLAELVERKQGKLTEFRCRDFSPRGIFFSD